MSGFGKQQLNVKELTNSVNIREESGGMLKRDRNFCTIPHFRRIRFTEQNILSSFEETLQRSSLFWQLLFAEEITCYYCWKWQSLKWMSSPRTLLWMECDGIFFYSLGTEIVMFAYVGTDRIGVLWYTCCKGTCTVGFCPRVLVGWIHDIKFIQCIRVFVSGGRELWFGHYNINVRKCNVL